MKITLTIWVLFTQCGYC